MLNFHFFLDYFIQINIQKTPSRSEHTNILFFLKYTVPHHSLKGWWPYSWCTSFTAPGTTFGFIVIFFPDLSFIFNGSVFMENTYSP